MIEGIGFETGQRAYPKTKYSKTKQNIDEWNEQMEFFFLLFNVPKH